MRATETDFLTDFLSHVLLSGDSDSLSRYDAKSSVLKLQTAALSLKEKAAASWPIIDFATNISIQYSLQRQLLSLVRNVQ